MNEDEIRAIVEQVIAKRTKPDYPFYFFDGKWLVTYDELVEYSAEIRTLQQRIARLERPWWRRWFSR